MHTLLTARDVWLFGFTYGKSGFPFQSGALLSCCWNRFSELMVGVCSALQVAFSIMFPVWIRAACERFSGESCRTFPWVYRTEPTRHISLWHGIHHAERNLQKHAGTCVLTDKKSKQEGGWWEAQPSNIGVSRNRARDEWGADSWNEVPWFERGMRSVLAWIWWWSIDLHDLRILPEPKRCLIMSVCWCDDCVYLSAW